MEGLPRSGSQLCEGFVAADLPGMELVRERQKDEKGSLSERELKTPDFFLSGRRPPSVGLLGARVGFLSCRRALKE